MPKSRHTHNGAPTSLLLTVRTVRKHAGYSSSKQIADTATSVGPRGWFARARGRIAWKKAESGRAQLKYWDLEVLQDLTGLPTGAVLCLSHITALLRDGDHDDALKFAAGMAMVAQHLDDRITKMNGVRLTDMQAQQNFVREVMELWLQHGLNAKRIPKSALA